jgi:hypothetical protein
MVYPISEWEHEENWLEEHQGRLLSTSHADLTPWVSQLPNVAKSQLSLLAGS